MSRTKINFNLTLQSFHIVAYHLFQFQLC